MLVNLVRPRSRREQFWALRDVSFDVLVGRTLGIIGNNGSGKSTILKIISGILKPTTGAVTVNGRVSGLLELGAGFHPDLTGRENVYLSGTILGMRQHEMRRRFDEIVAFSELERFIDTPVKHYSSGMYMRLAFAVATSVDPDVLLIDEVLAVGDSNFQKKCYDRIRMFQEAGKTIILVSHDLASISEVCHSAIWLHGGVLRGEGAANRVIADYLEFMSQGAAVRGSGTEAVSPARNPQLPTPSRDHPIRITKVELLGGDGLPRMNFKTGEPMTVSIRYASLESAPQASFGVTIARADGVYCYATNTRSDGFPGMDPEEEGEARVTFDPLTLLPGTFFVHAVVFEPLTHTQYDFREHATMFKVQSDQLAEYGVCVLPHRWEPRVQQGDAVGGPTLEA